MDFQYSSWSMILRMASHAALLTSLSATSFRTTISSSVYTQSFCRPSFTTLHRFSTEHTRSLGPQTGCVSAEYCERPVKYGEQHCREIGSHKRYDDKCKNESIWLAYNRADKTHYARYLKRKMTTAQFEQWSRYTVELRQKAENSEMELADYQKEL